MSSLQSLVTVCIVTFNSATHIGECLNSIKRQTWPHLITVVVDNASTDSTVEIIKNAGIHVQLKTNSHNNGFAAAQNQAISSTNSEYILVLNPDVVLDSEYIAKLVERLENNPSIGSVTGCLTFVSNPLIIDSIGLEMNWARKAVEKGAGQEAIEYPNPCEVFGVSGAAAMYSRKMINEVSIEGQFFDEDFFAYKEDVDVAWRAKLLGWKSWYEPAAKALHVRQWGSHSKRKQIALNIRRHSYKNRYLMIIKNESFDSMWWIRLPLLIAYEIVLNGYFLLRDPEVLVGSWVGLIHLLPRAWNKRKAIKSKKLGSEI
jgi:GT2 family glycosyltransferase